MYMLFYIRKVLNNSKLIQRVLFFVWIGYTLGYVIMGEWQIAMLTFIITLQEWVIMNDGYKHKLFSDAIIIAASSELAKQMEEYKEKMKESQETSKEHETSKEFCTCKYGSIITANHPCKNGCEKNKE